MTEYGCKHLADMVPNPIARLCCPVNGTTDTNILNAHLYVKIYIRPNRTPQSSETIRTYFNHSICSAIIIVIIDNLITRVTAMIGRMGIRESRTKRIVLIPSVIFRRVSLPIIRLCVRRIVCLFPVIRRSCVTSNAPARSNVIIRCEFLDRNSRRFPHFLHINQPP